IGFVLSGPGWWFADWMVVLTVAQVAAVLDQQLAAHASKKRKKPERPGRVDRRSSEPAWGYETAASKLVSWRDFWTMLQSCGRCGMAPTYSAPSAGRTNRNSL